MPTPPPEPDEDVAVAAVSADVFLRMSRRDDHALFAYIPFGPKDDSQEDPLAINAISPADLEKFMRPKLETDPLDKFPPKYHDFADVFSRKDSNTLPLFGQMPTTLSI